MDLPACVDRHPQVTGGVDGQAVRRSDLLGDVMSTRPPAISPVRVELERVERARAAVHQIHRAAVGAPTQAVRRSSGRRVSARFPRADRAGRGLRLRRGGRRRACRPRIGPAGSHAPSFMRHRVGRPRRVCAWSRRSQVDEAPPGGEQPAVVTLDRRDRADGPGTVYTRTAARSPSLWTRRGRRVRRGRRPAAARCGGRPTGCLHRAGSARWSGKAPPSCSCSWFSSLTPEVHDDLDVVRTALQRIGDLLGRHSTRDQLPEPVPVGGGERFSRSVEVPPVGVDRADDHVVLQDHLFGHVGRREPAGRPAAAHAREADHAAGAELCGSSR